MQNQYKKGDHITAPSGGLYIVIIAYPDGTLMCEHKRSGQRVGLLSKSVKPA